MSERPNELISKIMRHIVARGFKSLSLRQLGNMKTYTKSDLKTYIKSMHNKRPSLFRGDFISIETDILSKVTNAQQITSLNLDTLLNGLDFAPNNLETSNFEAFLAELRTIYWLSDLGFTNIYPIKG